MKRIIIHHWRDRCFSCFSQAGPAAWNSLPGSIKLTTDTNRFKKKLPKYRLFHIAFWRFVSAPGQSVSRALYKFPFVYFVSVRMCGVQTGLWKMSVGYYTSLPVCSLYFARPVKHCPKIQILIRCVNVRWHSSLCTALTYLLTYLRTFALTHLRT